MHASFVPDAASVADGSLSTVLDLSSVLTYLASILPQLSSFFAHPQFLWLLWLLPWVGLLAYFAGRRKRKALARLGPLLALRSAALVSPARRRMQGLCMSLGLTLLAVGTAGPQWGQDWSQEMATGRDIIVVLDVSRSMLAEQPSRQQRAKEALLNLCGWAERRGGHRLALVVFAGKARVVCPLTHDYDHFRRVLERQDAAALPPELRPDEGPVSKMAKDKKKNTASPRDLAPDAGPLLSGTRIGAGLELALTLLDRRFPSPDDIRKKKRKLPKDDLLLDRRKRLPQDILLLSDGEDPLSNDQSPDGSKAREVPKPRPPEWLDAARAAHELNVRVDVVGIGDPKNPKYIPTASGFLEYDDKPVVTKLEEVPLQEIARMTQGVYIPARTTNVPLGELYQEVLEQRREQRQENDNSVPVHAQRYVWFLGPALVLLAVTLLLSDARRRREDKVR
jgi:Ca-activated chloride channel family protein